MNFLKLLNMLDPSYMIVAIPIQKFIILKDEKLNVEQVEYLRRHPGQNLPDYLEGLDEDQISYVKQNIWKHRLCLWVSAAIAMLFWRRILELDALQLSGFYMMAGALISGLIVGWFAMSLKSLPGRYGTLGILITSSMFTAFLSGSMIIPFAILQSGDGTLTIGGSLLVALLYYATLLYDFADMLNLGLEPLQTKYFKNPQVRIMGEMLDSLREVTETQKQLINELKASRQ